MLEPLSAGVDLLNLSVTGRRELLHVFQSQGQHVAGIVCSVGPRGLGAKDSVDRQIHWIGKLMEASAGLEASLLCVNLGSLPAPDIHEKPQKRISPEEAGVIILPDFLQVDLTPPPEQAPQSDKLSPMEIQFRGEVDQALAAIGAMAEKYGVKLAFRSSLSSLESVKQALDRVNCHWFGLNVDPVTAMADQTPLDSMMSDFSGRIHHVRGHDAFVGMGHRTQPTIIGEGSVNWPQMLTLLDDAGYNQWLTIDPMELPRRPDAIRSAVKYLQQVLY